MRILALTLLVATTAAAPVPVAAAGPERATGAPDTPADRDVAYGPARRQRVDVYPAPADSCGEHPVVLWVHGGGWRVGDKARLHAKRTWARRNGWVLVSVNYRLTDPDAAPARRIQYPTHNRDVGRAVNWVVDHIDGYGGDPERLALIGHSAGAQIVSSVGVDERYVRPDVRPSIRAVVSLDTEGYDVADRIRDGGRAAVLYRSVFGDRPVTWADASPVNHLDADDPPQLVVRRGLPGRQRGQADFARALRDADIPTRVVPTPGYSHRDVNVRLGAAGEHVLTPDVEDFLDDAFA